MNSSSPNRHEAGFTLLEVIIAMAILAFISLGIYQATTETNKIRVVLTQEGDFHNGIRLAMNLLQRDISLIYSPLLIQPADTSKKGKQPGAPPDAAEMDMIMSGDGAQATQFWGPMIDKTGLRAARFVGTNNKMTFIAASHIRVYKDSPESDLAKITYELRRDEKNTDVENAMVLVKVESPNVYEDEDRKDKMQVTYPLLPGIRKLKFRYYRRDKEQWLDTWDSEKEDMKDLYPDKVEVSIEVAGPSRLNYEGVYQFRPEVPLYGVDPST